jgi:hypothetical protein
MAQTALQGLLRTLSRVLQSVSDASDEVEAVRIVLQDVGWDPELMPNLPLLQGNDAWAAVSQTATALDSAAAQSPPSLERLQALLEVARTAPKALEDLAKIAASGTLAEATELATDLITGKLIEQLEERAPQLARALALLGIVETAGALGATASPRGRVPHARFRADNLAAVLENPGPYLRSRYATAAADGEVAEDLSSLLFPLLGDLLRSLQLPVLEGGDPQFKPQLTGAQHQLVNHLFRIELPFEGTDFGLTVCLAVDGGELSVLAVPSGMLSVATVENGWSTTIVGDLSPAGVVVNRRGLRAGAGATLRASLAAPSEPVVLFGGTDGTRLVVAGLHLEAAAAADASSASYGLVLAVDHATLVVAGSDGDGFISSVLPPDGVHTDFDLAIGWSNEKGFYFRGGAALAVSVPVHTTYLGILRVETVDLALSTSDRAGLCAAIGLTAIVTFGPVKTSVERVGLVTNIALYHDGGSDGPADIGLDFKGPDGIGLAISTGPVKGGGYLFFAPATEQYAGILELEFKTIALKAIGLLTTRMPDGSKGFSLLIIITAEFPPVQLGFGFTLHGVGGLIGVNRTAVKEVLQAGVKTGALSSVLFPRNPVENAPQLLSDLRTVFPPAPDSYLVGPMAKLSWGTPTLVTLELGIIVQFPAPLRLIILGRLSMLVPTRETALLSVNLDALGIIDFSEGEASIDASLFDSRLANFVLTGAMAARLGWGKAPHFELAAGGFNPRFQPPVGFPALERLALTLAAGDNPRLRLECYFALTSNTLQFGAALDFHVHVDLWVLGIFSVDAHLGFDVLVRFSPFQLEADIAASIDLKRNGKTFLGVWLDLYLRGPGQWYANGQATFEFFGGHTIRFELTIGPPGPPQALSESNPIELLLAALGDPGNWSAQPANGGEALVTLRDVEPAEGEILVHPRGSLAVRQRVVPLRLDVEKFGETRPVGPRRFELTNATLGDAAADGVEAVREHFAASQFLTLSDDEKLSRPGFEAFEAGIRIGTHDPDFAQGVEADFEYDDIVLDADPSGALGRQRDPTSYSPTDAVVAALGADATMGGYASPGLDIAVTEPQYVVVETAGLSVVPALGATNGDGLTYTEARQRLERHVEANPSDAERLMVVAAHESEGQ